MPRASSLALLAVLAAMIAPVPTRAEEATMVVLGTGNRVSGTVGVLLLGDPAARFGEDVATLARHLASRCDLRLVSRTAKALEAERPVEPIVIVAGPVSPEDAARLRRHREEDRGLVLDLGGGEVPEGTLSIHLPGGTRAYVNPDRPGEFRALPDDDVGRLLLGCIRFAVLNGNPRHLPSAFSRVEGRVVGETLVLDVEAALRGRVTLAALTVGGDEILPEGGLRPVPLARADETLVRLRFAGEAGLTDEARYWLPDLVPGMLPRIRILGADRIAVGEMLRYRVLVHDGAGRPIAGCTVLAARPGDTVEGETDAHGSAVVTLPPFAAATEADATVVLVVEHARFARRFEIPVSVTPRPRLAGIETDRVVYRPGDEVRLRTILLDGLTRAGLPHEPFEVVIIDARDRLIARFEARTDRFGTAAFSLPLSDRITEGDYVAHVDREGASVTFRVEEIERPAFEVILTLDRQPGRAGEGVTGAVEIRTFDRVPLAGATVRTTWRGETAVLPGTGPRRDLRLSTDGLGTGPKALVVEVVHAGATVVVKRSIRIEGPVPETTRPAAKAVVEAPETVAPGGSLPVTIRSPAGVAYVDLAAEGCLLACGTAVLADGVGTTTLAVPEGFLGKARIHVRSPGQAPRERAVTIGRPGLEVSVRPADAVVRPGENTSIDLAVRDASGAEVPALLDIVALDEAYRAVAGDAASAIPDLLGQDLGREPLPLLVDDRSVEALETLADRIEAAAEPVLEAARTALLAGEPIVVRMPWGAPVIAFPARRGAILSAEPAVTTRPGAPRRRRPAAPMLAAWDASAPAGLRDRFVLPHGSRSVALEGDSPARGDMGLDWFTEHQSSGGGFHPAAFTAHCDCPACGGLGDPALRPGTTALATLAWLGAGETHRTGRYRDQVKAALKHLKRRQRPDGFIGDPRGPWARLNHAMATLAFTEAYALTGSPLFKGTAQKAIDVLVRVQREDGGFSEAGWMEPSLVLTTWATMALKSAREAGGLRIDRAVWDGIGRYVSGRLEPSTGAVFTGAEEEAHYPFPETDRPRNRAGMTALIRIHLGEDTRSEPLERLMRTVIQDLPEAPILDFQGVFFTSQACFQIGGETWKAWNVAMKSAIIDPQRRDGCARGSWDADAGDLGRVGTTAFAVMCLEVYYRYSRVFGTGRRGGGPDPRARSDFPDLLFADLARPTDAHGNARLDLALPDSVTTWAVSVGAWDGAGRYGRASGEVRARLPLHLAIDMPPRLVVGDRLVLPVRVRSTLREDVTGRVVVAAADGFEVFHGADQDVVVPAGGMVAAIVELSALRPGRATLRVTVESSGVADALECGAEVRSAGVPFAVARLVRPGEPTSLEGRIPDDVEVLRARLLVTGGGRGAADAGLAGLLRRPTGCFEQMSATLYPALLAYRLLREQGLLGDDRAGRARGDLLAGYQAILSYEVPGGGFSLYGRSPARADLTALGIHELLDLSEVVAVDEGVIDRAADWLADHLPRDHAERLYALGALRRAKVEADFRSCALRAISTGDPYLVALAVVHDLVPVPSVAAARAVLVSSVTTGARDARWTSARRGLFSGGPVASETETTALAALALSRLAAGGEICVGALQMLRAERRPDGAWSTTRETVAALRALLLVSEDRVAARGTLTVARAGKPETRVRLDGSGSRTEIDLGEWASDESVVVSFEGEGSPWITLAATSATEKALARPGPVDLDVRWPSRSLPRGSTARLVIAVRNRTGAPVPCPTAEIHLPAGLRVDRRALEDAADAAGFSRAEIREGRIHLYLETLGAHRTVTLTVPVRAHRTGRFRTGAARVYPYYEPDRVTVRPDRVVEVSAPDAD